MNLKQEVSNVQRQKLVLTQQMRRSIEILQMTSMEMKECVDAEMLENPLLEFDEAAHESDDQNLAASDNEKDCDDQIDWQEYFEKEQDLPQWQVNTRAEENDDYNFEGFTSREMSLHAYLLLQFHMQKSQMTQKQMDIGEILIDAINDDGYLLTDLTALAADAGAVTEEAEEILTLIQTFDPAGVGARTIEECLAIQFRQLGWMTPLYQMLLDEYLLEIANNQFEEVSLKTQIPIDELIAFKMKMKEMNPRPGSSFAGDDATEYVVPDGNFEWIDGHLMVYINEISAPHLTISRVYQNMLKDQDCQEEAREYINQRMNAALLFIRSIEARRETVRRITAAIAAFQEDYFKGREANLKPLTLKQVADKAEVHESTVSRAVRGKFIQTPRGTFELKSFFKRGYNCGEEEISVDGVKQYIRSLIENEDSRHPLSDKKLADKLSGKGLNVARRTVAKYREELGFLSSSKRKQPL